jgi:hypothetical protein
MTRRCSTTLVAEAAIIIRCCALIYPLDFRIAVKCATEAQGRSLHGRIKFAVWRRYIARKRRDDDRLALRYIL